MNVFLITVLILGLPVAGGIGAWRYKTQKDLMRIERLTVSLQMGLDYVRNLKQSDQQGQYPQLYRKINQDAKELDRLVERHSNRLDTQQYQDAISLIHVSSALKPKGNFLNDVTDGVLNLVEDIFPEAEKVTARLRPKETVDNPDIIYQAADDKSHETFLKMRHIQQVAPEILETYTSLSKSHEQIVEKLEKAQLANKKELLAIHLSNMRNFNDVLDGYLRIKEDPSQYFKAEDRLKQAKFSLESGQEILKQTLRQINENDMMNFEISLRLLQNDN
ncbi:hypothetical protein [Streptococcus ovuberis]|uniref:Membrane associated protein n=1 Tax=Streptococcus ovuberis TaxID=1936207 RepID=A0A7X6MX05_9STRE|nr:hypothetical protein [Streptococcus ovuberis]NKZ19932.1 hypothetical protein [Streptococcus ovuberis]